MYVKVVVIEAQADGIGRKAWGKAPGRDGRQGSEVKRSRAEDHCH